MKKISTLLFAASMMLSATTFVSCSKNSSENAIPAVTEFKEYPIFLATNPNVSAGKIGVYKIGELGAKVVIQLNDRSSMSANSTAFLTTTGRDGQSNIVFAALNNISDGLSVTSPVYLDGSTKIACYNDLTQKKGLQLALTNDGSIMARSNMGK